MSIHGNNFGSIYTKTIIFSTPSHLFQFFKEIKCDDASLYRNDSEPIGSGVPLLNGEYRMTMRLSNDDDENIATLIYHQLNKFHFTFGLYE